VKVGFKNALLFRLRGQTKRRPGKTRNEVVDKGVLDLELNADDAVDSNRWKAEINGYWCDSDVALLVVMI